MKNPKINTEEMRRIGSVAKEKSLSDSGQITAGKMLNRAADHIDNLAASLEQEQRDHAATKAELARMREEYEKQGEEYEKQGEALIFTERARSNANAGRQTNERYIEQLKAELARYKRALSGLENELEMGATLDDESDVDWVSRMVKIAGDALRGENDQC